LLIYLFQYNNNKDPSEQRVFSLVGYIRFRPSRLFFIRVCYVYVCTDIGPSETECTDTLVVKEEERQLLFLCGEREDSIVIESEGAGLDVSVTIRSKNIFPKRGVLFRYKGTCITQKLSSVLLAMKVKLRTRYSAGVGKSRPAKNLVRTAAAFMYFNKKDLPSCFNFSCRVYRNYSNH